MVQGGHETYIRNSFLGQRITASRSPDERKFSGVGISLMGNNAITDVVIFSAAVGIAVTGQANILTGVHCYNKATGFGGVGIKLKLGGLTQTRSIGCYLDYTAIVAEILQTFLRWRLWHKSFLIIVDADYSLCLP